VSFVFLALSLFFPSLFFQSLFAAGVEKSRLNLFPPNKQKPNSYAEFLAGMAFNSASLGAVHAMAHQLGGTFNLAHGVCNALLLPGVQAFNAARSEAARPLFIDVAEAMGLRTASATAEEAAAAVVAALRKLSARVGIPRNIEALGVSREDFMRSVDDLTRNALKDACGLTNPVPLEFDDVRTLFVEAFEQQ
jgi:alcohol dehydrogenase